MATGVIPSLSACLAKQVILQTHLFDLIELCLKPIQMCFFVRQIAVN
jgi:hypothetical protein